MATKRKVDMRPSDQTIRQLPELEREEFESPADDPRAADRRHVPSQASRLGRRVWPDVGPADDDDDRPNEAEVVHTLVIVPDSSMTDEEEMDVYRNHPASEIGDR